MFRKSGPFCSIFQQYINHFCKSVIAPKKWSLLLDRGITSKKWSLLLDRGIASKKNFRLRRRTYCLCERTKKWSLLLDRAILSLKKISPAARSTFFTFFQSPSRKSGNRYNAKGKTLFSPIVKVLAENPV